MAIGMTWEQFWKGPPEMAKAFRESDKILRDRVNQELWLEGIYMSKAIEATIGNALQKKGATPIKYPEEPLPITKEEIEERKQREQKLQMERMKAAFMADALRYNGNRRDTE